MTVGNRLFAQDQDMGALPTLYAATMDLPRNAYIGPDGRFELRGHPAPVGRSKAATDERDRRASCGSCPSSSPASASRRARSHRFRAHDRRGDVIG